MIFIYIILFANQFYFPAIGNKINISEVQILKKRLFQNYDREILPTTDKDQPVSVLVSFLLLSVFGLDMKQEILSTSGMFQISWKDEFLTWNKTYYNGLDKLTVTINSVWKPDVIIMNSINKLKTLTNDGEDTNYVSINSNGIIKWRVNVNMETNCRVSMELYPFETQICNINLTKSYLDDESEILLSANDSMGHDNTVPSGEWEVSLLKTSQQTFLHPEGNISGLQLRIQIKRYQTFYFWNYVMPTISLSFADCFTFILPVKSGEKLGLAIFVFLANAVFIRLFNDSIPPVFEISKFGVLLWVNLLLSGIVILLNIIITAFYYRQSPKGILGCCGTLTSCFKCKTICQNDRQTANVGTQTDDIGREQPVDSSENSNRDEKSDRIGSCSVDEQLQSRRNEMEVENDTPSEQKEKLACYSRKKKKTAKKSKHRDENKIDINDDTDSIGEKSGNEQIGKNRQNKNDIELDPISDKIFQRQVQAASTSKEQTASEVISTHRDDSNISLIDNTNTGDTNGASSSYDQHGVEIEHIDLQIGTMSNTSKGKQLQVASSSKVQNRTSQTKQTDLSKHVTQTSSKKGIGTAVDHGNIDTNKRHRTDNNRKCISIDSEEKPLLIKHRDVQISMKDSEDTFIGHGPMKIKLGRGNNQFPEEGITWSDVSRNIDIISAGVLIVIYIGVYAYFLNLLLN